MSALPEDTRGSRKTGLSVLEGLSQKELKDVAEERRKCELKKDRACKLWGRFVERPEQVEKIIEQTVYKSPWGYENLSFDLGVEEMRQDLRLKTYEVLSAKEIPEERVYAFVRTTVKRAHVDILRKHGIHKEGGNPKSKARLERKAKRKTQFVSLGNGNQPSEEGRASEGGEGLAKGGAYVDAKLIPVGGEDAEGNARPVEARSAESVEEEDSLKLWRHEVVRAFIPNLPKNQREVIESAMNGETPSDAAAFLALSIEDYSEIMEDAQESLRMMVKDRYEPADYSQQTERFRPTPSGSNFEWGSGELSDESGFGAESGLGDSVTGGRLGYEQEEG